MRRKTLRLAATCLLGSVLSLLAGGGALAITYDLQAGVTTKTMPDGQTITMWGFGPLAGPVTVPGPQIVVPPGDNTLTINLTNNLPQMNGADTPVSIIIPGQIASMVPVRNPDGRIRSFTHETMPGAPGVYTWTNLKPGTYLYESGTHQAVQIQMGLYGAMIRDFADGMAYDETGADYGVSATLIYSEIDPVLHAAVDADDYGPTKTLTSTIDYAARYYLLNGESFSPSVDPIPIGIPGDRVLLRFVNAGLRTRTPMPLGLYMDVVAEDGNWLNHARPLYVLELPAGKTMDAIVVPEAAGYIPVFDRSLGLTNDRVSGGGMLAYLEVAAATQYTLDVVLLGAGGGTVMTASMPGGIYCGMDCSQLYNAGTEVTLTAVADPGSVFMGWGGPCMGSLDCTMIITANTVVTATFGAKIDKIGYYRNTTFYLDIDGSHGWNPPNDGSYSFGPVGSRPVAGDWNGDGFDEIGAFLNGVFYLDLNANRFWDGAPDDAEYAFGQAGDLPVAGDWDGDGTDEIGVFRGGYWYLDRNGNGVYDNRSVDRKYHLGLAGYLPVTGDWNADGMDEIGTFSAGTFRLDLNGNGMWNGAPLDVQYTFGVAGQLPVAGDWNADGMDEIGTYLNGSWFLDANGNGAWDGSPTDGLYSFGTTGTRPAIGYWAPMAKSQRVLGRGIAAR